MLIMLLLLLVLLYSPLLLHVQAVRLRIILIHPLPLRSVLLKLVMQHLRLLSTTNTACLIRTILPNIIPGTGGAVPADNLLLLHHLLLLNIRASTRLRACISAFVIPGSIPPPLGLDTRCSAAPAPVSTVSSRTTSYSRSRGSCMNLVSRRPTLRP